MERTYTLERAAHARAVATAKGRRVGRPVTVDRAQLDYAAHLRTAGHTIAETVTKTGIPRADLYRHLPPRPPEPATAGELPVAAVSRPPAGVPHSAPLRESSPNQAYGHS